MRLPLVWDWSSHSLEMVKAKPKKSGAGGAQSHLRARLEYLQRAAIYLHTAALPGQTVIETSSAHEAPTAQEAQLERTTTTSQMTHTVPKMISQGNVPTTKPPVTVASSGNALSKLSRQYITQMRGVSLKAQLRLPIEVKRSFCKRCDLLLTPGVNCTREIRNDSKGRAKPWADVLIVRCLSCGTEKRFPQTDKRSKKLSERVREKSRQKEDVAES